jgi:short-subunit dehydrogenase
VPEEGREPRMRKLMSYKGRNAVVTGASSGIGKLMARRLASAGANLVLVARRGERLQELAAEVRSFGCEALVLPCDVADRAQCSAAAQQALQRFGHLDLLVNNAGYGHHRSFLDWDVEDIERMMRVNYLGSVYWTKALLPGMIERRCGWVVFIASVAGKLAVPDESAYVASKFAMVGLAEALSMEVEEAGVHVLTVCPGAIRTDFFDEQALRRMPPVAKRTMVDPEPLVDAIMKALAAGKHEITFPRFIVAAYLARVLAPGFMRRSTKRRTLGAWNREEARPPARGDVPRTSS